jgi:hypothetical protein
MESEIPPLQRETAALLMRLSEADCLILPELCLLPSRLMLPLVVADCI